MKVSFTSNLGIQNAMRQTINQSQSELLKAQTEVSTGTYADRGVSLGYQTGRSVSLTVEKSRMNSIIDSNSIATQRLSASQSSLTNMSENVQTSLNSLIALSGSDDKSLLTTTTQSLQSQLDAFVSSGNTSSNGEFLFAGINTGTEPLKAYNDTSAAKTTFDNAFQTYFGFTPSDPAASSITVGGVPGMQDFVENTLEPLYTGSQWSTDWSTASSTNMTSQISASESVQTSTNANTDGFKKFALASVLGIELLGSNVNSTTRQYISQSAISYMGEAVAGVDQERSALGLSEARVNKSNATLQTQVTIVETSFNNLNEVDAYAASTKVNSLLSQMEASYTLTARIQKLSLVNFL
jgi:flagellar hook-associated protein 3 FlgL